MQRNTLKTTPSAAEFGARAAMDVAIVSVAVLVIAVLSAMIGCGGPAAGTATTATGAASQVVVAPATPHTPTPASPVSVGMDPQGGVTAIGDSLPPDVMASVEDSLAAPGDVIEITARGSDDVTQIGLSDGMGRVQLFTRDGASRDWHILYRVPLKTLGSRLPLSVTALNDLNRWRRVWVFVNVRPQDAGEAAPSPTPTTATGS